MRILAIDPGCHDSALVLLENGVPIGARQVPNEEALAEVKITAYDHLAIEMVASYGMAVGVEVFETCLWIGRFIQASGRPWHQVYRKDVKLHLCGFTTAKDANIRQALIDRFGPGKEKAVGYKKTPGPLYGITADLWQALAVGVTFSDKLMAAQVGVEPTTSSPVVTGEAICR